MSPAKGRTLPKIAPTQVVPAEQPVVEQTEEERREQEARDYVNSLRPTEQMTEERIQEIRADVLRSIPHVGGKPVPETTAVTEEQLRANPSNYVPAIADYVKDQEPPPPSSMMGAMLHGYPAQIRPDGTMYVPEHPLLDTRMPYEVQLDYLNRLKGIAEAPRPTTDSERSRGGVYIQEKAAPVEPTEERQGWVCVQGDGIRTNTNGGVHEVFYSDAHLLDRLVRCPQCDSISVRKVMPGEDPSQHP